MFRVLNNSVVIKNLSKSNNVIIDNIFKSNVTFNFTNIMLIDSIADSLNIVNGKIFPNLKYIYLFSPSMKEKDYVITMTNIFYDTNFNNENNKLKIFIGYNELNKQKIPNLHFSKQINFLSYEKSNGLRNNLSNGYFRQIKYLTNHDINLDIKNNIKYYNEWIK
jgi:hypothetical protein